MKGFGSANEGEKEEVKQETGKSIGRRDNRLVVDESETKMEELAATVSEPDLRSLPHLVC